jgi:hypothetical protein
MWENFILIFTVLSMAGVVLSMWMHYCNEKTLKQRTATLPKSGDPRFQEKLAAYKNVSYDQHLYAVATFRNWKSLYDPIVFEKD